MFSGDQLIILDADGTTVDAFSAINQAFAAHDMDVGDVERFQNRRCIFKYLGGVRELPKNQRKQLKGQRRSALLATLTEVYREQGSLYEGMDFFIQLPLRQDKTPAFRAIRESLGVNPVRAYACGDEKRDFQAAFGGGMHPFMVSYGFERFERLTQKIGIPEELISRHPEELKRRILHTLRSVVTNPRMVT